MKTINQKLAVVNPEIRIIYTDSGYFVQVEGKNIRGDYAKWSGVVATLPEVYTMLDLINTMEKE